MRASAVVMVILAVGILGVGGSIASAYDVVDSTKVYLGDPSRFSSPAVLEAAKVFAAIPEYRQIIQKGLTRNDAEFWLLLNKANERFRAALVKVATDGEWDLIAEKGFVTASDGETAPPDVTETAIAAVK